MSDPLDINTPKRNMGNTIYPTKSSIKDTYDTIEGVSRSLLLEMAVYCFVMLLLAKGSTLYNIWAIAPAFAAAVIVVKGRRYFFLMMVFTTLGLWLGGNQYLWLNLLMTGTLLAALAISRPIIRKSLVTIPLLVFLVMISVKGAYFLLGDLSSYYLLDALFESFFAAGISVLFYQGLKGTQELQIGGFCSKESLLGIMILVVAILIGFLRFEVLTCNLGRIIGIALVMVIAFLYGGGYGAAAGVIVGFSGGLFSDVPGFYLGMLALSGLIAGVFKSFTKFGVVLGFFIGQSVILLSLFNAQSIKLLFVESLIAVAAFILPPTKFWQRISAAIPVGDDLQESAGFAEKIKQIAELLKEISRSFRQVSSELEEDEQQCFERVLMSIAQKVCSGCPVFSVCWQKEKKSTRQHLCTLFNLLEVQGRIGRDNLPDELKKRCARSEELLLVVSCLYEAYMTNNTYQNKLKDTRSLVADQMEGVVEIITRLPGNVEDRDLDIKRMMLVRQLKEAGIEINTLRLIRVGETSFEVELTKEPCKNKMECNVVIKPIVETVLKDAYDVDRVSCAVRTKNLNCSCRLNLASALRLNLGFSQVQSEGTTICGDSYTRFRIKGGIEVVALSDGMGVGARAAKESNTVISLLEQLLAIGFNKKIAIKIISAVLEIRSQEETFATLDLLIINTYTGEAEFIKIGAAPSFLKRGNQIGIIKTNSYPMGILDLADVKSQKMTLRKGDLVVLLSDGVLDSGEFLDKEEWMVSILKDLRVQDPQEFSQMVLRHSLAVASDIITDDMTVLAAHFD